MTPCDGLHRRAQLQSLFTQLLISGILVCVLATERGLFPLTSRGYRYTKRKHLLNLFLTPTVP